jgi:hypothetical protein
MRHRLSIGRCGPAARWLLAAGALGGAAAAVATATPAAITTTPSAAVASPAAAMAPGHPRERGFPLIQSYVPAVAGAESQNFYVARDPRGFLYFANLGGLLVYDGAWWQRIPIGRQKSALAVACDAAGRVAVGGIDDLGYLAADTGGTLRFVSLIGQLPPAARGVGQPRSQPGRIWVGTDDGLAALRRDRASPRQGGRAQPRAAGRGCLAVATSAHLPAKG